MSSPRELAYGWISSAVQMPSNSKESATSLLTGLLFALLPSFVQRKLRPHAFKPRRLSPTSWLDGLRGVAALFVYINHYTGKNYSKLQRAYNDHELVPWSSPVQLPFIRVIFCGLPMVHIFFVISGFALSYRPMTLLRAHNYEELNKALSSSVFRRGFRLFLPTMGSTLFVMLCRFFGIMSGKLPSFLEHIWDWYDAFWKITDVWRWDVLWMPPYDVHLWTIAIEFSHSMLLFLVITATCRLKPFIRVGSAVLFIIYSLKGRHWGPAEFLSGMLMAELTVMDSGTRANNDLGYNEVQQDDEEDKIIPTATDPHRWKKYAKRLLYVVFLTANLAFALFVVGWPNGDVSDMPGFGVLYKNTMEPFLSGGGYSAIFPWYFLAAVQIIMVVHQTPTLQDVFTSHVAQYLGDISFSLYLMHGPMQDALEWRIVPVIWHFFVDPEAETYEMWQYTLSWACGLLVLAPITIWVSDIFWRLIDVRSVRFARWLEGKCVINI